MPWTLQEDAARALAEDLRAQIDNLQTRLREAEMHLEHLTITRKNRFIQRLVPVP
ncbi:hypothetical protein [Streptomyces antimycoticus]|uniref:hypothetical protein n=1 Tax=Streptomyces antimycoticus TaxID=68175 RepID=UPI00191BB334|nr:hypothetical protein [Streptomyces antimycoticus]